MSKKFLEMAELLKGLNAHVESCNRDVISETSSVTSRIEHSFFKKEISEKEYIELKDMKLKIIDKHKDICICMSIDEIRESFTKLKH